MVLKIEGLAGLLADLEQVGEQLVGGKPPPDSAVKGKAERRGHWKPPQDAAKWSDLYSTCTGRVMDSVEAAREAVGVVERGDRIYLISRGNWSTEHVICSLGEQLGPTDLWMATWAVNDDAVLRLADAMQRGFVREVRVVVDERMKVLRPAALDILQTAVGAGHLGIMPCHMKAYCLHQVDGDKTATIIGSCNWTQNPRPEALVIDSDPRAAAFISGWVGWALSAKGPARPYAATGKLRDELIVASGRGTRDKLKADLQAGDLGKIVEGL